MKIILDESVPQKLRLLIDSRHAVVTTWFQGWSGLENGDAHIIDVALKLAGDVIRSIRYVVSRDGTKMTVTETGILNGAPVEDISGARQAVRPREPL